MTTQELQIGDFFAIPFGFKIREFYVINKSLDGSTIQASMKGWRVSDGRWLDNSHYGVATAKLIAHGTEKWYWKFLPWRDSIVKYKRL